MVVWTTEGGARAHRRQRARLFKMHPAELVYGVEIDKKRLKELLESGYKEADRREVPLPHGQAAGSVVRCYGNNGDSVKDLIALIAA